MAFFDRFRQELRRYAEGVHELGDPAPPSLAKTLPPPLRDLYASWNGLRLFTDSIVLEPGERLERHDGTVRLGEALGAPLELDEQGRLYELDEAGDRVLAGTAIEPWLNAMMARESLVVDREGEFKDVFDEEQLSTAVRQKRVRAGLKADPGAATWQLEAAELAFEAGELDEARRALEAAVAADPGAGIAWELLGGLARRAGRLDEAEQAFVRAAEATVDAGRRAERWAEAARAAREAGRDGSTLAHHALAAAPAGRLDEWRARAEARLQEGDLDGALNLATLVEAVRPDEAARKLASLIRARRSLKTVD